MSSKSPEFFAGREPTQDDILLQNILKEVLGCMGVSSEGVDSLVTAAIQMGWENTVFLFFFFSFLLFSLFFFFPFSSFSSSFFLFPFFNSLFLSKLF